MWYGHGVARAKMKEITFEFTNYCEHNCKFCSSNATNELGKAKYINFSDIHRHLNQRYDRINISGGEPLAHPNFYSLFTMIKKYTDDIVVYSNLITHRRYNSQAIDGVYLEATVTVTPETDKVSILRRVKQGREADRPEVHLSCNNKMDCSCEHRVVRPDGSVGATPCNKYKMV